MVSIVINYINCYNPCNVSRLKFNRRVQGSNEDTETTTFTKSLHKNDEKSFNRADDNAYYHEFRDELLVIDSIIQ